MPQLRRALPVLAVLGLGVLAAGPLLANAGFLLTRGGGDSPFLLLRLYELVQGLNAGQFPVRWMPDADYGYGYPFFNYYAALPYYGAALLRFVGLSYVTALKLTQTAGLALGAAGMYAWARSLRTGAAPDGLPRAGAWLAAAAYTFAPFHLANLYVRGDSLSELWAMAFYPLVLWRTQRCLDRPDLRRGLSLALVTGLLVLTHNISALNFMPFVALYLVVGAVKLAARQGANGRVATSDGRSVERPYTELRLVPPGWVRTLMISALALAGGLALAAFFWLPALGETSAVQIADVTAGYFYYGNHFRAADLVQTTWLYNADTGVGLPSPFAMGLAQTILAALGLAVLLVRALRARRWTRGDTFVLAGLAITTFMITPASAWVWAHVPLVRFTQFPWRFLSIQALFTAALTAQLAPSVWGGRWGRWALAGGLGLALAWAGLGGLRPEFVPLSDADVTPERLHLMEYFSGNIGSTIGYEYLPRAVQPRPFASDTLLGRAPHLQVLSGQAEGTREWQRGAAEGWMITVTGAAASVAVPTNYWPGWQVWVDGQEVPAHAAEGLDWIAFDIGPGMHTVELRLGRTPLRAAAEAVSGLALLAWLAGWVWLWRRADNERVIQVAKVSFGLVAILLVLRGLGLVIALSLPDLFIGRRPPPLLSIDFAQLTYYHDDSVRFSGDTRLVFVAYDADHVARGETLTINSAWQAPAGTQVTFSLVPGSNLLSQAPVMLVSASAPVDNCPFLEA